jgi:transcriptional regulator with XRE-family HTH domain
MKTTGKGTPSLFKQLGRLFRNREYRHSYAESFTNTLIAAQLKANRERRTLSQAQLATLADMKQSHISRIENVNYDGWSVRTLRRIARAFDLVLIVKFESFGALVREMESFNRSSLERPTFAEDPAFKKAPTSTATIGYAFRPERISRAALPIAATTDQTPIPPWASPAIQLPRMERGDTYAQAH